MPESLAAKTEKPRMNEEREYVWWLCLQLEHGGWKTETGVPPDADLEKSGFSREVDIVASHPQHGRMGIEAKHCYSKETPNANYRQAFKQITEKYWDLEFRGSVIPTWVVAVSFSCWPRNPKKARASIDKLGPLFNEFGVGYTLPTMGRTALFQETCPRMKICFGPAPNTSSDTELPEPISEHVVEKRGDTKLSETY